MWTGHLEKNTKIVEELWILWNKKVYFYRLKEYKMEHEFDVEIHTNIFHGTEMLQVTLIKVIQKAHSNLKKGEVLVLSRVFLWFSYLFFVIYPLFTFNAHFQRWKSITKVKVTLLCCVVISTFPCGYGSDALWSHNGNLCMSWGGLLFK